MSLIATTTLVEEMKKMDARKMGSGAWSVLPYATDNLDDEALDRARNAVKMAKVNKRVNIRTATIIAEDGTVEVNTPVGAPAWVRRQAEGKARNQAGAMVMALRLQRKLAERQQAKKQ